MAQTPPHLVPLAQEPHDVFQIDLEYEINI